MSTQRRAGTDPPGITAAVLLGAAGAAVAALAGAALTTALPTGAGIALLVWTVNALATRITAPAPPPPRAAAPAPAGDTGRWLARATAAADRLAAHRAAEPQLADAAAYARTAAEQLRRRARAVAVLDASAGTADSRELRRDQHRLEKEAAALPPGALKSAKESSAAATAERAAARERLDELRDVLLATLESTTLRLEAAAERGSIIVSLRAAGDAALEGRLDLTPLGAELAAVQAGLDKLEEITHDLLGEG
ncbi:hypothetical protein [Streptomyces litchfieldiae]|uniref:Uncharacterized protein n=1 Tax=Streptomyces litchfieldiae TaxID=3075543 RepID=A0ABU2MQX6_9ACTN|nr:hypothetical protein [Streptomyces sp. DSM 44938]MDT0344027.1 hypothetical protein [Streptomyces sp. DSM 44938]